MNYKNRILLSHPTGNENVRSVLKAMFDSDLLYEFYTSIAAQENSLFYKISGLPGLKDFRRRHFDERFSSKIKSYPFYELGRQVSLKLNLQQLTNSEQAFFSIDSVYRHMDKLVASAIETKGSSHIQAVYAYEDGAFNSFKAAKAHGVKTFYDLPIGYWKASRYLLAEEFNKKNGWEKTLMGFKDSEKKLDLKDQELALSDHVFVASSFTANTLKHYSGQLPTVSVIPYGFPPVSSTKEKNIKKGSKLKLLFVGGLSQRKGLANVFEAVSPLKKYVDLCVVGNPLGEMPEVLKKNLAEHQWIQSLPHNQVLEKMRESDLVLFPSLFEGFGLVITEAMSQGTPVITTECTAGPDIITNNKDGWIIKAGSTEQLREKIEMLISSPELVLSVGEAARLKAAERPWSKYGNELIEKITSIQ